MRNIKLEIFTFSQLIFVAYILFFAVCGEAANEREKGNKQSKNNFSWKQRNREKKVVRSFEMF